MANKNVKMINLTPHPIDIFGNDNTIIKSFKSEGNLRLEESFQKELEPIFCDDVEIPVVSPAVFTGLSDFELVKDLKPNENICVSKFTADALVSDFKHVIPKGVGIFSPDSGNNGVVRKEGRILGVKRLVRCNEIHEEIQYLSLIENILRSPKIRDDRTGTGTYSKFGVTMKYSLRDDTLPLFTTKNINFKNIIEELLWFMKGKTDATLLSKKGIKIWDSNSSRKFLDKHGFKDRKIGDCGPIYGFQWRHFGAKYVNCDTDYTGQGIDQLMECINLIKNDPCSRRIVMSAWNPVDLKQMVLPPCHSFVQFYVDEGKLSCMLDQRSGDIGLGVPYNVASYAALTHIIANITGTKAESFIHVIGDAHVYKNHVDGLNEQIKRSPFPFPKLFIKRKFADIESISYEDFELNGYKSHPAIKLDLAIG